MIIDTSAVIAILQNEPETPDFSEAINGAENRIMSAVSLLEASMVSQVRRKDAGERELDLLLLKCKVDIVPFTEEQAHIARRAFRKYGKGRHAAGLNFGDCIVYALAKDTGEPLLFKGTDFGQTDIAVVDLTEAAK
jgi:ribonuclease VapC